MNVEQFCSYYQDRMLVCYSGLPFSQVLVISCRINHLLVSFTD